jgi:creatinine amidohydrolase/Fe(II)-dependent formamide hydrolase-like protein
MVGEPTNQGVMQGQDLPSQPSAGKLGEGLRIAFPGDWRFDHGPAGDAKGGVIGRPSAATAQKGHAVLDSLTTSFRHHLQAIAAPGDQDQ